MKLRKRKKVEDYFDPVFFAQASSINKLKRSKLVYMHPDDFLGLARTGHGDYKEERVHDFIKSGERFPDMPYLWIDTVRKDNKKFKVKYEDDICQVIAHEGRHRTRALKELGFTLIPVIIHSTNDLDIKWYATDERPTTVRTEDGYLEFIFKDVFKEEV